MTSLQGPGRQNSQEPYADLIARLEQMRRELGDLTSSVLKSAGIRVSDEGMTIQSALDVEGALDVSGSATVSGPLGVSGAATFSGDTTIGGNAAITGTLSLPAGIIDNEALANPVTFNSSYGSGSGYAHAGGSWQEVAVTTLTVPAGFTRMQFTALGMANADNSTGSTQSLYVRITRQINGAGAVFNGQQGAAAIPAGWQAIANCTYMWSDAVTPGDVHRFAVEAWTTAPLAASAYNYSDCDVSAIYRRD